jgi:hypothetical protein
MNPLKSRHFTALVVIISGVCFASSPIFAQLKSEGLPESFEIGPQGQLTCVGYSDDACAYFDEIPTPEGTKYLVQGNSTRRADPTRLHLGGSGYATTYFALLCNRNGDSLRPVFNFLEGQEKASDVHIHDLDADGTPEIIVTGIFDSRGSYASVYRLRTAGDPERIFTRRANTPNSDFEVDHGSASLIFEQRSKAAGAKLTTEVFHWNGQEFALES